MLRKMGRTMRPSVRRDRAMRASIEFRTTVRTRGPSQRIDDAISAKRDKLKRLRPEIDEIITTAEIQDLCSKVGAGYEGKLSGTIFFKPGAQPNLPDVDRTGQECFDYDFRTLPLFVLDTTSKTATTAPILCRKCRIRIGEVPNYLRLVVGGPAGEAQLRDMVVRAGTAHVREAHVNIDPATIIF